MPHSLFFFLMFSPQRFPSVLGELPIYKNSFRTLTQRTCASASTSILLSSMSGSKYAVALHAGATESWKTDPTHQQRVESILNEVALEAGSRLSCGAKALDVVQAAVSALEDCEHFNAGRGAVLNEDGEHEVRWR